MSSQRATGEIDAAASRFQWLFALALGGWLASGPAGWSQTWAGGGADDNWSTAGNWNPAVPVNSGSANVLFSGDLRLNPMVNVPWEVRSIGFDDSASIFVVMGQPVGIGAGGVFNLGLQAQTLENSLALRATQIWTAAGGALSMRGPVALGGLTLTLDGIESIQLMGAVSGSGRIIKQGAGTLTLGGAAANTFTGLLTVTGGEMVLAKVAGVTAIAGNLTIGGSTTLATVRLEASEQIADGFLVTVARLGGLDLNGFSETIGGLQLSSGHVATGAGMLTVRGGLGSLAGDVPARIEGQLNLDGATQPVSVSQGLADTDLVISASISNGGLVKVGSGTLVLAGASTFAGSILTESGVLGVAHDLALGTGPIKLGAGRIRAEAGPRTLTNLVLVGCWFCQPGDPTDPTFSGSEDLIFTGPVRLGGIPLWTVENTGRTVFSGAMGQDTPGRGFLKDGPGLLLLSGASPNTYSGPTSVRGGVLLLGKASGLNAVPGTLDIGGTAVPAIVRLGADEQIPDTNRILIRTGGVLDLDGFVETGTVDLAGGNVVTGPGRLVMASDLNTLASAATATIQGTLDLGGVARVLNVGDYLPEVDLLVSATIANGAIYKAGSGRLLLTGDNAFAGGFVLLSGTLGLGHDDALGTGPFYVASSAANIYAEFGNRTLLNRVDLHASLTVSGAHELSLAGPINLSGKTMLTLSNPAVTLGAVGETGGSFELVQRGPGTLTLVGSNSFTRGLIVEGGAVELRHQWAAGRGVLLVDGGGVRLGGVTDTIRAGPTFLSSHSWIRASLGEARSNALLRVSGSLALGGRIDIEAQPGFGPGTYRLIEYVGPFSTAVTLGALPPGFNFRLVTTNAGLVELLVMPQLELACPTSLTVDCVEQIPPPDAMDLSAQGGCGGAVVSFESDRFTTNGTAVTVARTYRAADACGNVATCTQIIVATGHAAAPVLTLLLEGSEAVICWQQACASDFLLEETNDPGTPGLWTSTQAALAVSGPLRCVRVPAVGQRFFRLRQQPQPY